MTTTVLATMAAAGGLWTMLTTILLHALFVKRVYRSSGSSSDRKMAVEVIGALNQIPCAFKLGVEVWNQHMVPTMLVSRVAVAVCSVEMTGLYGDKNVVIEVYRPRLGSIGGKPLVPDRPPPPCEDSDTIQVLERSSNRDDDDGVNETTERVVPLMGLGEEVMRNAEAVASCIVEDYRRGLGSARVYVLHGRPGCGKSSTVRMVTQKVSGVLYPTFDPTTSAVSVKSIMSMWSSAETPVVIGYEEFDVTFRHIAMGTLTKPSVMLPDALNKASWNAMLDCIKRKKHVIFIMVTNKSFDEIRALTCGDASLLRLGRVDSHFVWPCDGNSPTKLMPYQNETAKTAKTTAETADTAETAKTAETAELTLTSSDTSSVVDDSCRSFDTGRKRHHLVRKGKPAWR
jgi:hypothetical protein